MYLVALSPACPTEPLLTQAPRPLPLLPLPVPVLSFPNGL